MNCISRRAVVVGLALSFAMVACAGEDTERTVGTDASSSTFVGASPSTTRNASSTSLPAQSSGARPPVVDVPDVPMAFDEQSSVVVAIVEDQTWVFDVESLTWGRRSAAPIHGRWFWTRLVYEPASDRTVAITEMGSTYVYDADGDVWTRRVSSPHYPLFPAVAALNTQTKQIVVLAGPEAVTAWSYSMADDTWDELPDTAEGSPTDLSPMLIGYAPAIDRFVTITGGGIGEPLTTRTFDADTGAGEEVDTDTPDLFFHFSDLSSGTEMVYVPVTGRFVLFTGGITAEYDPAEQTWITFPTPDTQVADGLNVGALARVGASLVYDSTNERVLMYGGTARMADGRTSFDDLWAYDPMTHEWSMLLDATQAVAIP